MENSTCLTISPELSSASFLQARRLPFTLFLWTVLLLFAACSSESRVSIASSTSETAEPPGAFLRIHGKNIWYLSEGQGEPLILIPGGPGFSHRRLHHFFSPLRSDLRLISYDPLGRGRSDQADSESEYTLERDVDDLEELRAQLGFEK